MRRRLVIGSAVAVVLGTTVAIMIFSLVSHDPDRWHVDPLTAPTPSTPNSYRVAPEGAITDPAIRVDDTAPTWAMTPDELALAFDAAVLAEPRVEIVGGSAAEGWVTYVQSTSLMRFPDYVSVRFLPTDGGSTLAMFSRSRFGQSDLGVNEKRVKAWLDLVPR